MIVHLLKIGCRQERADRKKISLNRDEYFINPRHHLDCARGSEKSVQLIDITVCLDARIVLRNAAATEQSCLPGVTGLRVNLHVAKSGYIAPNARDKGHNHHWRWADGSFRLLLCWHARSDRADCRHFAAARRSAHCPLSREVHL